jgi:hypothetical protein
MKNNEILPAGFLAGLEPLTRRAFLSSSVRITAMTAAVLALPGQVLAAGSSGGVPTAIKNLSPLEYRVFDKLRLVMLPTEKYSLPSSTEIPVMENVDVWVGHLNKRARLLVRLGAETLEYGTLWRFSRFSQMSDDAAQRRVHAWQTGNVLERGVASSLKMLLTLGYWQDARTWPSLQYDGPVTNKWGIRRLGNAPMPR